LTQVDASAVAEYTVPMAVAVDKIVSEALELPPPARAFVAEKLIESLDAVGGNELSPAWREEIRRRCREVDEGTAGLCDAEAVFARAYAALL
jgi:putative addiction module component (TIGR02574 family)